MRSVAAPRVDALGEVVVMKNLHCRRLDRRRHPHQGSRRLRSSGVLVGFIQDGLRSAGLIFVGKAVCIRQRFVLLAGPEVITVSVGLVFVSVPGKRISRFW
jgi:hypothetical protein